MKTRIPNLKSSDKVLISKHKLIEPKVKDQINKVGHAFKVRLH